MSHLFSVWRRSWHIIRHDYQRFATEPQVQYSYHRRMILFWMFNFLPMNTIVAVDIWATLNGHDKIALLMTAILLALNTNYSLYANWDTEVGDAHGAYASMRADQIQLQQLGNNLGQAPAQPPPTHATF